MRVSVSVSSDTARANSARPGVGGGGDSTASTAGCTVRGAPLSMPSSPSVVVVSQSPLTLRAPYPLTVIGILVLDFQLVKSHLYCSCAVV